MSIEEKLVRLAGILRGWVREMVWSVVKKILALRTSARYSRGLPGHTDSISELRGPAMPITRRQFTVAASATLAWAARPLADFADEKPTDKKFKKAVKIGMVKEGSTLLDKFKLLKELGFDGVELDAPSSVTVDEAKRCIGETGLEVPGVVDSVHWNQRLSDPREEVRAKGLEALRS